MTFVAKLCIFGFFSLFLISISVNTVQAQRLSTRTCTANSTVVASRQAGSSNASAVAACATFCSSATSTTNARLYTDFCGTSGVGTFTYTLTGSCGVTSYFYNAPLVTGGQTVVPTLTNTGSSLVIVPCSYAGTPITGATLNFSNPGSATPYYVNQQVVASTTGDKTVGYVTVNPTTGALTTSTSITPPADVTQTISFTLSQRGTAVYSNTVNITFVFQSCQLQLSGPSGPVNVCNTQVTGVFPGLTFTIPNAPAGVTIQCDLPTDGGGGINGGSLQNIINTEEGGGTPLPAPAILQDSVTDVSTGQPLSSESANFNPNFNNLFVLNYNTQVNPTPTNICVYGPNGANSAYPSGCQYLRFSATPTGTTPFFTGYKVVQVCYTASAC